MTDTASLIHGLKPNYTTGLFPRGGLHWNEIGLARATQAVIADINRQAGTALVPSFDFTYTMTNKASGEDRDLVDVVNMLFPRLAYPTPKVFLSARSVPATHRKRHRWTQPSSAQAS